MVFVDVERRRHRITQIAALAVNSEFRELESFDVTVCHRRVRQRSKAVDSGLYPWVAAEQFATFLRRYPAVNLICDDGRNRPVARLVAHNAERFDAPLLHDWYDSLRIFLPAARLALCTKQRAMAFFLEHPSLREPTDYKLGTLCEYFGVTLRAEDSHVASNDVRATVGLYRAMHDRSVASFTAKSPSVPTVVSMTDDE
jgi:hypothetical protein